MTEPSRAGQVAAILEAVTVLSRAIAAERRAPFHGRHLTRTQMQTLYLLAHARDAVTPTRLAATLEVTPGAVTQLVEGLREERLVQVIPHPRDARSRVIRLTSAAEAEIVSFEKATVERLLPLFDGLTSQELDQLAAHLARITETS